MEVSALLFEHSAPQNSSSSLVGNSLLDPAHKVVVESGISDAVERCSDSSEVVNYVLLNEDVFRLPYLHAPAEAMMNGRVRDRTVSSNCPFKANRCIFRVHLRAVVHFNVIKDKGALSIDHRVLGVI